MVVSKDNKRRRKETETPTPTAPTSSSAAAALAVESSPEMPKRTKVQAQRKFAQGQSAPSSATTYSAVAAAAAAATAAAGGGTTSGPSTSAADSHQQPPIEILPNKCPKPQDFLTFLCFRGTSALPAHLDYLNQGKPKANEVVPPTSTNVSSNNEANKKKNNSNSNSSKKKRGRPAKPSNKAADGQQQQQKQQQALQLPATTASDNIEAAPAAATTTSTPPLLLAGAVRKRAEVITEGNRRGARRNETLKRRSNRASNNKEKEEEQVKQQDDVQQEEEDDEDEFFSAHDASSRNGAADETLSKTEATAAHSKRGRQQTRKTAVASPAVTESSTTKEKDKEKEKGPVKRVRQRESPIFIPSPESSGRMTRQRAFFEPVKVMPKQPPDDEADEEEDEEATKPAEQQKEKEKEKEKDKEAKQQQLKKANDSGTGSKQQLSKEKTNSSIYAKDAAKQLQQLENGGTASDVAAEQQKALNVFDFSSDDEQPLAKSIKLKKGGKKGAAAATTTATATAPAARGRKAAGGSAKKQQQSKEEEKLETTPTTTPSKPEEPPKAKRGKALKKTKAEDEQQENEKELEQPEESESKEQLSKKQNVSNHNARPARRQAKANKAADKATVERSVSPSPQRNQRPSRKTKEAAAIYMGIIGHKLQLADDEEDDLSLSSFPDIPNVKEMEKMEKEIKKNAAGKEGRRKSPKPATATTTTTGAAASVVEPPAAATAAAEPATPPETTTATAAPRRGRPPKQSKGGASTSSGAATAKPQIEGMLVKKGALALAKAKSEQQQQQQQQQKQQQQQQQQQQEQKDDSDAEEDFLINEELNETKRKLEKSFSDSDDEPLAIKVPTAAATATSTTATTTAKASGSKEETAAGTSGGPAQESSRNVATTAATTATIGAQAAITGVATTPASSGATAATTGAAATTLNCTPPKQLTSLSTQLGTPAMPGTTQLTMLPLTAKPSTQFSISPPSYAPAAAAALKTMEKKSPVPTSKILNVPATYALPGGAGVSAVGFAKTTSYLPQASPHYHTPYVRPSTFAAGSKTPQQGTATTPGAGVSSPLKYQTPPTTYPPPIEAYQCPKINPNFLTPKYDRSSVLPRANNNNSMNNNNTSAMNSSFSSPRATLSSLGGSVTAGSVVTPGKSVLPPPPVVSQSQSLNLSLNAVASTSAAAAAAVQQQQQQQQQHHHQQQQQAQQQSQQQQQHLVATPVSTSQPAPNAGTAAPPADPLKDEIGSILAQATLMPSKEESGKIFGIASVSLAQSSGPDNTKCTLGKCGSIHKPVLGPVVPTEGYFGDQLTSKERRKAKVNMTHEQIQKWLIECSSNPDEIQDDLDDEFDESLRPQQSQTPPGPTTRDDKESTSFSSSSNKTRGELGKSESAWSAKGPSLKATPVLVSQATAAASTSVAGNRSKEPAGDNESDALDFDKCVTPVNLTQKSQLEAVDNKKLPEKKSKNASGNSGATTAAAAAATTLPVARAAAAGSKRSAAAAAAASNTASPTPSKTKAANKKQASAAAKLTTTPPPSNNNPSTPAKRTPIYQNQSSKSKAQTQLDNKQQQQEKQQLQEKQLQQLPEKSTTSVYAFGKDEETAAATTTASKSTTNRRRNAADNETAAATTAAAATPPPALSERSPTKKRAAAAAAATAVQLTLSPTDKLEKPKATAAAARQAKKQQQQQSEKQQPPSTEKQPSQSSPVGSDAEGATFYIPLLQGASGGGEGGIQGVAVKLGREGPDGPNQKVVMQATLVTKAQMDTNSKPLPDNELVKTLLNAATTTTNDAAAATTASNSNNLKASTSAAAAATTAAPSSLVRVNSNSSLFSGSAKSRTAAATAAATTAAAAASATNAALAKKYKDDTPIKMANNTAFPRHDDPTQMVEAPIFKPTEKEFADPIEFIERITPIAARFGICKIIPPASFKPECRISDEMRFTAYNQYVHKMLHRWGPSAKELSAIKKYLATQSIVMNHAPWIGGMEVDLPRLYHTVQELGGLKEVIEKKKWARVAEEMCIPKLAQDRVTKLDDIYCKYLLPYDTLSPAERQKLFDEVEADWAKREARARRNADRFVNSTESVSNEEDDVSTEEDEESEEEIDGVSMECIVKGRSMPLSQFYRIARNTMALWFKSTDPTVNEVEAEFWRHVAVRDSHVCVHSGSIDSSGWGYGFPSPGPKGKGSNYARHPWNLKVLTNNAGSVLRSLGPVMGVTVPTLHVGMLFSACCWYRDPHGLSWIEYLHTGASKLWYGIPDDQSANFRSALTSLIPTHCQNKTIWLPCDTVMVPPHMLTDRGVSLCRIEQKPGEFIVVFPRAYTSSLATGYVVSESVYFATMSWLDLAKDDFRDIHESCEPAMFSLEQLLFALGYDQRVNSDTLQQMLPMLNEVCEKESAAREQLRAAGVTSTEKVQAEKGQKAKKQQQPPYKSIESECDLCRANLYISMVRTEEGNVYCLQHALKNLNNGNIQAKQCKLIYAYNVDDILQLIRQLQEKIQHKQAVKKK